MANICIIDILTEDENISVFVNPSLTGVEYKLDNGCWQSSNLFNNVGLGEHYIHVRDENGNSCSKHFILYGLCPPSRNDSFTVSYVPDFNSWVSFHDYIPTKYITSPNGLFTIKGNEVYEQNTGERGNFYGKIYSSYIDLVQSNGEVSTTVNVNWVSDVVDSNGIPIYNKTIDYIRVWNNFQATGKITIDSRTNYTELQKARNPENRWYFNNIRNIVIENRKYVEDIRYGFELIDRGLDDKQDSYNTSHIYGLYSIIRLEMDNIDNNKVSIHDVTVETKQRIR
jgi:hypothetical protein